jgi:hypothetical protein
MRSVLMRNRTSGTRFGAGATTGVVVLALCLVLTACSGGGKKKGAPSSTTTEPPKVLTVSTASLKIGTVDVQSAGPNVQIDKATGKAVLDVAQKYIDNAVFSPLTKGELGGGFASLFDAGVKKVAIGPDKAALSDIDVGKVTSFTTKAKPVTLSALVGTLGEMIYIATDFDVTVKAVTKSGPLTIGHHVELTFAKTAKDWLVTAYRVQTVRRTPLATTTTTATRGTTP